MPPLWFHLVGCECTANSDGQIEVLAKCYHSDYIKYNYCYWYNLFAIMEPLKCPIFTNMRNNASFKWVNNVLNTCLKYSNIFGYFSCSKTYFNADIAFVDRADIKAYVGPPTLEARYEILRSCIHELLRVGILTHRQVCINITSLKSCFIILVASFLVCCLYLSYDMISHTYW